MFFSISALIASNDETFTAQRVVNFQSEYGTAFLAKILLLYMHLQDGKTQLYSLKSSSSFMTKVRQQQRQLFLQRVFKCSLSTQQCKYLADFSYPYRLIFCEYCCTSCLTCSTNAHFPHHTTSKCFFYNFRMLCSSGNCFLSLHSYYPSVYTCQ